MSGMLILYLVVAFLTGAVLGFFVSRSVAGKHLGQLEGRNRHLEERLGEMEKQTTELQSGLQEREARIHQLEKQQVEALAAKDAEIQRLGQAMQLRSEQWDEERRRWQTDLERLQNEFAQREKYLSEKLENLARQILEETSRKFTEHNRQKIDEIIRPFKEDLQKFKTKVEQTDRENLKRTASLMEQIKNLKELNLQITREAQNLTRALKGDTKTQGIWGEAILESILEKSGLEKGREYITQQSFQAVEHESRQRLRPDVIVFLPENKAAIIDAKVSLKAYEQYINTEDEAERETALKAHLLSVRKHIDELARKEYHRLDELQGRTPDFTLMFIPVEPAFAAALRSQPDLYDEALRRNVVMTTPTTLLALLKMIDNMWKNEYRQRNVQEILRQATSLYEKFTGFTEDLIQLGRQLQNAQKTYESSMNKLSTGKDNLIRKVERMRKLGLSPKKQINPALESRSREEDED